MDTWIRNLLSNLIDSDVSDHWFRAAQMYTLKGYKTPDIYTMIHFSFLTLDREETNLSHTNFSIQVCLFTSKSGIFCIGLNVSLYKPEI